MIEREIWICYIPTSDQGDFNGTTPDQNQPKRVFEIDGGFCERGERVGGGVNGGQVYGAWPGLHNDQLYDHADLAITTDYRQVLSELLTRRLGGSDVGMVFPGFAPAGELGIFRS